MHIYVARQPIFDRNMKVYGYELLYRKTSNNCYEGVDSSKSSASLIDSAYFEMNFNTLIEEKRAFINFSEDMLFKDVAFLLPKDKVVVEILENIQSTKELLEACLRLKEKGYLMALDDFTYEPSYIPIIDKVDIIKLEFPVTRIETQKSLIKKYGSRIKFLAEKVETREEFQTALDMGYEYFQGYFFSRPIMIEGEELPVINTRLIRIMNELHKFEPDFQKITEIIEIDVGLSYKLLRIANSVFFGAACEIHSIKTALIHLGLDEIKKWIYLMMLKDFQIDENRELIKTSLLRAKMMELIAERTGRKARHLEFFLTGLFSSIDVLLCRKMEEIIEEIAVSESVKDALLNKDGEIGKTLVLVMDYEKAEWENLEKSELVLQIKEENFLEIYVEAIKWTIQMDY